MKKTIDKIKRYNRIAKLWLWQFKKGGSWSYYRCSTDYEEFNGGWIQIFSWEEVRKKLDQGMPPSTIKRHIS